MTRPLLALLLLVLPGVAGTAGQPASPAARPLEIDTVFVDRSGSPVRDIRRDEVEVWMGGLRMPLQQFIAVTPDDTARSRRALVLVLDDITLDPGLMPRVREAARRMVERLGPDDQMAIISLNGDAARTTNDRAELLRAVDRYNVRATGVMRPDMLSEQVLKTIASVSQQMSESGTRRRIVVGIGSGWVFDTPIPPPMVGREMGPEWVEAMRAMASANVTLYVIDPAGVGRTRFPSGSTGFARETGGHAFMSTNDMRAVADQIMTEASTYYILEIADPPMFRTAPLREIEVRVKRGGVTARARRAVLGAPPAAREGRGRQ